MCVCDKLDGVCDTLVVEKVCLEIGCFEWVIGGMPPHSTRWGARMREGLFTRERVDWMIAIHEWFDVFRNSNFCIGIDFC